MLDMQLDLDLQNAFQIKQLQINDESHLHAGHAGAASGGGHFNLTIVAPEIHADLLAMLRLKRLQTL